MKKIKKYYRIIFQLTSPLSVGSGENNLTDRDIIRDSRGVPYIPGTALAGVYRSLFSKGTADNYFGPELTEERIQDSLKNGINKLKDSDIVTYDAYPEVYTEKLVTKRDMVALDDYKTAVPGAKFDFQVLEPGLTFVTYIEQNMDDPKQQWVLDEIASAWMEGRISVGAKTGRGYGHTKAIKEYSAIFDLRTEKEKETEQESQVGQDDNMKKLAEWLSFDMYDSEDKNWSIADYKKISGICAENPQEKCSITLELRQQGGISVRQYTTEVDEADYKQLTARRIAGEEGENEKEGTPVIPGTSWAGAFRAQMGRLDSEFRKGRATAEKFFGKAKNKGKDNRKSRISFSESRITGGKWVVNTRNAIDRFTGGTVDGALYTEKTYYNGRTVLEITWDFSGNDEEAFSVSENERKKFAETMAAAILDLNSGYMAVGGLTAIGRGLFAVEKITVNKKEFAFADRAVEDIYPELVKAITGREEL